MELWIRSQDKEILTTAQHLDIYDASVENEKCFVIEESGTDLGSYETYERALEVLDEIQNILKPIFILDSSSIKLNKPYKENGMILMDASGNCNIEQLDTYVYEMPKE